MFVSRDGRNKDPSKGLGEPLQELAEPFVKPYLGTLQIMHLSLFGNSDILEENLSHLYTYDIDEEAISSESWMPKRYAAAQALSVQIHTEWDHHSFEDMFHYRLQIQRLPYNYSIHLNYVSWKGIKWPCPFNTESTIVK